MKELTLRPMVWVCMQAMVTQIACAQSISSAGAAAGSAAPVPQEQRRVALREAVQAQVAPQREGQMAPSERRLSPQEHAELRQQLMRISAERRSAMGARVQP